jgi:hypothetical protein
VTIAASAFEMAVEDDANTEWALTRLANGTRCLSFFSTFKCKYCL